MADEKLKRAIFEALSPEYDMVSEYSEHAFSDKFEKNMQKLIARQKKPYYSMINTVGKRAACVILAVLIAFTAAILNVEALRTAFRDFFVNIFEKFSIVQSADENNSPETIEDIYIIAYDLSGFTEEVWSIRNLTEGRNMLKAIVILILNNQSKRPLIPDLIPRAQMS